jgi:hypothetical protein
MPGGRVAKTRLAWIPRGDKTSDVLVWFRKNIREQHDTLREPDSPTPCAYNLRETPYLRIW